MSDAGQQTAIVPEDFAGRTLVWWTRLLAKHRIFLTLILLLSAGVFSWLSGGIRWQPDILQFFSGNSAEVQSVRAMSEQPGLATQLRMDVHFDGRDGDVLAATRELANALRRTNKFRLVWTGAETSQLADTYSSLLAEAPALLTVEEQRQIVERATPEYLRQRFAAVKRKLADPDGEILLSQLRTDPLGLSDVVADRMKKLSPANENRGEAASFQDGVLVTHDGSGKTHAMIVSEPFSLPSNQKAAEKTLKATYEAMRGIQSRYPGMEVWLVGAHRGYVENAHTVMRDVARVSVLGSILVAIAIALYFRRVSTALLCIIPASVGIGTTLGVAGLFHTSLPLILLGFAGLLCGSTTDYGIQIIAEIRRLFVQNGRTWHADLAAIAARKMLGPISMSVATSVTGFAALGLSDSPGLRSLGLFVAVATLAIWVITFLILPAYLGPWVLPKRGTLSQATSPGWFRFVGAGLFLATTCYLTYAALHVRFNSDPRALDGASAELRADELHFAEVWGNLHDRAIVLARATSADACLTLATHIDGYLRNLQRDGQIGAVVSPAQLLPSSEEVTVREDAWKGLWTPDRRNAFQAALRDAARQNGLRPDSFITYADRVASVNASSAQNRIVSSPAALFPGFIDVARNGTVTLASIVQMRTDRSLRLEAGWVQELRLRIPEATVLSGQMLAFDATERARAEAERLAPCCLIAILLPLWIYFRSFRRAWLAILCLVIGFLWVLGSAQLIGGGLNLLCLVPILFTLGVAVDYGIYAASDPAVGDPSCAKDQTRTSATGLCALTTMLGSGALIVSAHPAMRWLGITLVSGIAGGYLTSFFVVGELVKSRRKVTAMKRPLWRRGASAAGGFALATLTGLFVVPIIAEWLLGRQGPSSATTVPRQTAIEVRPGVYESGRSWMRWRKASEQSGIWEITIAGTPEERGASMGALCSPIDVRIENEMLDQFDQLVPEEWARWMLLRAVGTNLLSLPGRVPEEYQREVYTAATTYADPHAYLAPSYARILSYHALHDVSQMLIDNPLIVPNQFACTGVISLPEYSGDGKSGGAASDLMLGRVFDFEGGESFGRQKSITYVIPPASEGIPFAHVAWPGLAGCVTGMNAEKIALFINAAATKDFRRIGTPTIFMARDVLEHCHNIDDADRVIRSASVFVSDIIVVADGKTGRSRIFEKSPGATAAYDVALSAVVTNHLITPTFADDPVNRERVQEGTTMQRYARARQLLDRLQYHVTVESLAALVRDKKGLDDREIGFGNRNAIDGLIASHAVIMDVTKGQMWVGAWPNCEGAFIGVDVLKSLQAAADNSSLDTSASPPLVPEDRIMQDGTWERVLASRETEREALDALRGGDLGKAKNLAVRDISLNGSFYFGHEMLGRALLKSGEKSAGTLELNEALKLDPPYAKRRIDIQGLLK